MSTTTNLDTLKINYLTQAQYDTALENDQINDNELYFTPSSGGGGGGGDGTSTPTANATAAFDSAAHMNSTDMTTQEVEDFIDGLDGQGANLADYVVEQGINGIWTYRKWNSGIAECWGRMSVASRTYSASGGYYNVVSAPPTGLFLSGSYPVLSATGGIETCVHTTIGFTHASDTNIQTYLVNRGTGAVTAAAWVCWHLTGRWK